jgi:bifunctional enzyme CysN/CysC
MLGIRQVVVCVNKMDLVGYDQKHFEGIEREYRGFLESIGAVSPRQFIPISAIEGVNLAVRGTGKETAWYKGPTLLEVLDGLPKAPPKIDQPLRMPVQAVYKFTKQGDDRRIIAGRIEAGRVKVGDKVVFSPSNKVSTIKSIEGFNTPVRTELEAGWSTGFTLTEEIYITRGEVMSHVAKAPQVGTRLRVNMIWLGKKPFTAGRDYKLKLGTTALPVRIHKINKVIDASKPDRSAGELGSPERSAGGPGDPARVPELIIGRHDVADVILEARQQIAFDLTAECEATGRFVIVDGYDVAGGGIITEAVSDDLRDLRDEARTRDFNWVPGGVTSAQRAARNGHRAALVMFVGNVNAKKHELARAVEKALFADRCAVYMLDGTNVLLGVDNDLWVDGAKSELVRRFGEVAHLLLNAGLIVVSTTNTIGGADATAVQALIPDAPLVLVQVGGDCEGVTACDLKLGDNESEAEVVARVKALLEARQITAV